MDRYLHHVSLTTGHVHRNVRSATDNERVERCAGILAAALAGNQPVVPGIAPPLMLHARGGGHCLSVWLCLVDAPNAPPVTRIAIAANSECGIELWRSLHANAPIPLATQNHALPPEPWCAERLDVEPARAEIDLWGTLQDFECCVAWAFLERPRIEASA
jgi:hypothetical protein